MTTKAAYIKAQKQLAKAQAESIKAMRAGGQGALDKANDKAVKALAVIADRKDEQARRQTRYGKLVRGWDWRTTPELLERAEQAREKLGVTRTEFLERAIAELADKLGLP